MLKLIDSHTHVQFSAFEKDYKEVIKRAQKLGIGMITVGTQKDTSRRAVEIAHEFENVWATVGLHPIHTEKSYHDPQEVGTFQYSQEYKNVGFMSRDEDFDYEYYKKLASDPKVVAIGECGFDYYRNSGAKDIQKEVLIKQIKLAQELKKPLMFHCRPSKGTDDAYEDLLGIISSYRFSIPKISHFYAGSLETAKKLLEQDFYFTFGGVITFSRDYDEIVKYIPLDKIMVETDAPYVAPEPYRGQRNEPAYVAGVAKKLAEIKGINYEQIAEITVQNCRKVFGI